MQGSLSVVVSGGDGYVVRQVGRVAGEDVRVGVEAHGGVVHGGGDLAEPDGDQPHLAVVVGDVAGREDARQVRAHGRVHHEVAVVVQVEAPLAHRSQVGGEPEGGDGPLARDDVRLVALDGDLGLLQQGAAVQAGHLRVDHDVDAAGAHLLDGGAV